MNLSVTATDGRRQPLVTVCVPTIGRTTMLTEALESIHYQTYPNIEILLLDNASDGEGRRIMQRFAECDSRVRLLRCEERVPMFANFNRGLPAARGEFVTFLFDDDLFQLTLVERAVDVMTQFPAAGLAGSNYALIEEAGSLISRSGLVAKTAAVPGRQYISDQMQCSSMIIASPGTMFRRDLLTAFPFDESLSVHGGDLVMRLRMAEVTDVALIAESLVSVRVHPQAETASLTAIDAFLRRTRMLQEYIAEYSLRWPDDRAFSWMLKSRLAMVHSATLVWDWIALGDEVEAEQRRLGLSAIPGGATLGVLLGTSERLGLTATRRRERLAPIVRRFGPFLPTPYK